MDSRKTNQARLRLAWVNPDLAEVPRRYAQSTSGRVSSTGTAPPLSRSNAIEVDSAIRCLVEMALRKYPTDVSQRRAKESCSGRGIEFRYERKASMARSLLPGKILSIPTGNLPGSTWRYDFAMSQDELATANFLRILHEEYGDSPSQFEIQTGYSANMVAQIKGGTKKVGPMLSRKLENLMGLERFSLDKPTPQRARTQAAPAPWPLSVRREDFEALNPRLRAELDEAFTRLVIGAGAQQAMLNQRKTQKRHKPQ